MNYNTEYKSPKLQYNYYEHIIQQKENSLRQTQQFKGVSWNKPFRLLLVQSLQKKHLNDVRNLLKLTNKDIVLVCLLLTLNKFHILFWCFHCWLRTSKGRLWLFKNTSQTSQEKTWDELLFLVKFRIRAVFHRTLLKDCLC